MAITYAAVGEKDAAFSELEKAFQARDWFLQRLKGRLVHGSLA